MNQRIKEYTTGKGKKRFKFAVYAGKNDLTGQSIQVRKTGFKSYKDAEKAYNSITKKIKDGTYNAESNKRYRIKDLYELWVPNYKQQVRESTFKNTQMLFKNHIIKDLGSFYVDKLTPLICQKIINKWYKENSYSLFRVLSNYFSKLLNYALKLGLLDYNPMKRVDRPRNKEDNKKKLQFYTKDELKRFLNEAKKENFRIFVLFRLLSYSGMRLGELLALDWSDINFENNTVRINKTKASGIHGRLMIDETKTKAGNRVVNLDQATMNYLVEWKQKQQHDLFILSLNPLDSKQLLFPNQNNGLMYSSNVNYWNKKISKNAGLKFIKLHGFRHTHASILFEAHATMKEVQVRLGHASIKTTMDIYTHLTDNQKVETVSKFIKIMNE